jgi:hypothetical protein
MLAALCFAGLSVLLLAHFTPVIGKHVERELAQLRATNGLYYFDDGYTDEGDYVLIGQLPQDDYARGGVYFLGSSEMNTALMPWELTPAERRLIHNYSIGDLRHTDARHYVRMMVEENDLLQGSGNKTTVILGLSFQMARKQEGAMYVADLFHRHGLYTYDWAKGIHRAPLPSFKRYLILERDRANRFLRILFLSPSRVRITGDSDAKKREHMLRVMDGDWQSVMRKEVQELAALIDYLQARNVRVKALLPPSGTWQDELPYEAAYREMVRPILEARKVSVTDFGNLLSDEEFMDAIHARYVGQVKVHEAYRGVALQALAEMGTKVEP